MRIEIMDGETVTNTIDATPEFAEQYHPGAWRLAADQGVPVAHLVPQKVTARQAHQALILAGLYANVQPAISSITDPVERQLAQVEWDRSNDFERTRPLLIQLGYAIGLDDAGLDQLFVTAAGL